MSPTRLLLTLLFPLALAAQEPDSALVTRARAIHARVITLDTHDDIETANFTLTRNYTQDLPTQVNLPKMEAGGLVAAFFVVYVGQRPDLTPQGYERAMQTAIEKFDAIHRLVEEIAPDRIALALTPDDVRRIAAAGKRAALIGIENGYPLGEDLSNIRKFYDRGGRYLSLAHNGHSQLSDSNTGERDGFRWNGLSPLGREAVAEMNRVGMMIDVSHPSKASMMQTLALTRAPVIASHSATRALCDHSRNLDDEQLRALAKNGGVAQIVAFGAYVRCGSGRNGSGAPATVRDFVDHIDHAVRVAGLDHVGISSDFDGGGGVEGWRDASETFNVTLELVRRGYTEEQIGKLWSGNLLRVMAEVQAVAARGGR